MAGKRERIVLKHRVSMIALFLSPTLVPNGSTAQTSSQQADSLFRASDACIACHNDLTAPSGEDISFGYDWRSSMMGNAARDPYWHAGVRREVMDHPSASSAIQDKCSTCHMPMARYMAHLTGGFGEVFANLPSEQSATPLAVDGVSCPLCHQIRSDNLDSPDAFTGGFSVDHSAALGMRALYGPFQVDRGRQRIMRSASGFEPTEGSHMQSSALCGSCHTLYTHALNEAGEEVGELAEQMPYREWLHSDYRQTRSCQDCHMPEVDGEAAITGVLGQPRDAVSRHVFRGGNFFMPRLLNRYRNELGVQALPQELEATATRSADHLRTSSATLEIQDANAEGMSLRFDVLVTNEAGHKLPTAYPSRRAWLHVTVHDANGAVVFESGALRDNGSIVGNDNDDDPNGVEAHHSQIDSPEQVQIYEAIMEHYDGGPTTGLLNGVRYIKDNRILPRGFDKSSADWDVAVRGAAEPDGDFTGGTDRVRYSIRLERDSTPLTISVQFLYQPISFRWAQNLAEYDAAEPQRFVRYYNSMSSGTHQVLAQTTAVAR